MSDFSELSALISGAGAELYDIETVREEGRNIYRVYIHSADGVSVELCAKVSRLISPYLDVNPPISGEYSLEVSSRGIERKLKTREHFAGAVGETVKITLKDKRKLRGKLLESGEMITVENYEPTAFDQILKAHIVFGK